MLAVTVTESGIAQESTPMLSKLVLTMFHFELSLNSALKGFATKDDLACKSKLFEFKAV